jgi:pimeloyl-ACP methyl ester carboxylesterase
MGHAHPVPDVTIDYTVAGDGRSLVVVHGITESRRTWDPLIAPLIGAGYRVIAVDLRGHGASSVVGPYDLATMAGDLGAVLVQEQVDDALLDGHSLGGAVESAFAAGGPCRGVVNVDQPLALSGFKEVLGQLEPMLKGSPDQFHQAISTIFDQMVGPLDGADRWRVERLRDVPQEVVLGVWEAVFTSSVAELDGMVDAIAGSITVPYLALHGIDPGDGYATWLTGLVPTASVDVWHDHGHYPHLVEPGRFVDRVVHFDATIQ